MSRTGRCEHGRLLRHAPELTTVAAATSGRPSGLHAMACHTASMVAPSDPRWRAATVGGFIFGGSDPPYRILAVQAEKDGITTIFGELMGKSLSILHIVVTLSQPPPYGTRTTRSGFSAFRFPRFFVSLAPRPEMRLRVKTI